MSRKLNTHICLVAVLVLAGLVASHGSAKKAEAQSFDFSDYDAVLKTFVNDKAMVNYKQLKAQAEPLDAFVGALAGLGPDRYETWGEKDKIAFWLNAYNGLTLKVIIDNYPIKASFWRSRIYPKNSIRQIAGVWDEITFNVMGRKLTLEHIEHKILRVKFNDPRIHMAMVCAAMGCPPLRNEPYVGAKLDEQLNGQAGHFLANSAKFNIDRREGRLYISPIFKWFVEDFVKSYGSQANIGGHDRQESAVLNFIASYLPEADKNYVLGGKYDIKYLKYDWSLNEQQSKR